MGDVCILRKWAPKNHAQKAFGAAGAASKSVKKAWEFGGVFVYCVWRDHVF